MEPVWGVAEDRDGFDFLFCSSDRHRVYPARIIFLKELVFYFAFNYFIRGPGWFVEKCGSC